VTVENGCRWKRWVAPWLAMVSCGCIVVCGDTSGTWHHQLGGSYLPDRAAGEVLPAFGIPTKPAADICCCPSGSSLIESVDTVLVRRFPRVHPVTMNAVGMTAGAAVLLAASLVADEPIVLPHRPETWAAMTYLVVIGSVVVFLLYLIVLRYWAASRASYGFVIIPFVTLVLSGWLDNEPVGLGLALGGLLVLAGVYVGALRAARLSRAALNVKD
jgi:drug/metabolite transporter (DMT)-like permease